MRPLLFRSQASFALALVRKDDTYDASGDEKGTAGVYGSRGFQISEHGDNRSHNPKDSVRRRREGIAGASVLRWEDFRLVHGSV